MPGYRVRMHSADGRWHTMFCGAESMMIAMELAAKAVHDDDPEGFLIDEVHIKRVTPWRDRQGSARAYCP